MPGCGFYICDCRMDNFEADIAARLIEETAEPVFLIGKAGTGKTTFLKNLMRNTRKNCVVIAPTGVAAINAGGVTIHSMFGLPTKAFVPVNDAVDPNLANNKTMLSNHFHYNKQKLDVIREMELLIIDEVSMVRADLMDAVDFALQFTRRNEKPFGGVQVLFIGDMYQLPPVMKDYEWPLLSQYYKSHYFFDSLAFEKLNAVYIELRKVYRQRDRHFIQLLNNIRHQEFEQEDYEALQTCYAPDFEPGEDGWITLTTHNQKANAINEKELARLAGEELILDATVNGDFYENMYPAEPLLRLKKGAQVMFLKNDTTGERRYFNGRIGVVDYIDPYGADGEVLKVRFPETGESIWVEKVEWENIRYSVNSESNEIEQERIGSFEQYPLRLAWAITIHKSQGLTFDKAVIDAGESFAPGQVYVALSRCTSMEFMKLKSMISNRNIMSDPRIVEFSGRIMREEMLERRLELGKYAYAFDVLLQTFDFEKETEAVSVWNRAVTKIKSVNRSDVSARYSAALRALQNLQQTARRFQSELRHIFYSGETEEWIEERLRERCTKAVVYFRNELLKNLIVKWNEHFEEVRLKAGMKKYSSETGKLMDVFWARLDRISGTTVGGMKVYEGPAETKEKPAKAATKADTYSITLELLQKGNAPAAVAELRNMAVSTIEGHVARLIRQKKLNVKQVMDAAKIAKIEAVLKGSDTTAGAVMSALGGEADWAEIRWVLAANDLKG